MQVKTDKIRSVAQFLSFDICLILYQNSMRTPQRSAFSPSFPVSCENDGFKDKAGGIRIAELGMPIRGADKAQERDSRAQSYRERGRDSISRPPDPRSCERCLRVVVSIHSWLQASLPIILYILDSRIMSSCPHAREDAQSPTQLEFIPSSADPLVKLSSRLGIVPVSSSLDLGVS
jgi:hypothetical protein